MSMWFTSPRRLDLVLTVAFGLVCVPLMAATQPPASLIACAQSNAESPMIRAVLVSDERSVIQMCERLRPLRRASSSKDRLDGSGANVERFDQCCL